MTNIFFRSKFVSLLTAIYFLSPGTSTPAEAQVDDLAPPALIATRDNYHACIISLMLEQNERTPFLGRSNNLGRLRLNEIIRALTPLCAIQLEAFAIEAIKASHPERADDPEAISLGMEYGREQSVLAIVDLLVAAQTDQQP